VAFHWSFSPSTLSHPQSFSLTEEEEYDIDFEKPENNVYNISCHLGPNVKNGGEILNTISIYLPVLDVRDYHNKKYKAVLLSDRTGIRVTIPTLPQYQVDHVEEIHALEGSGACESTLLMHTAQAKAIKKRTIRQTKHLILSFPFGMTCNNKHFNYKNSVDEEVKMKLKVTFRLLAVDSKKEDEETPKVHTKAYVFWKIVIDGEKRYYEDSEEDSSEDDFADAELRMSNLSVRDDGDYDDDDDDNAMGGGL
jgi:hypothetical protein